MTDSPRLRRMLIVLIVVSIFIHFSLYIASSTVLSGWRWMNYPLHGGMEFAGSFIAILVGATLLSLSKQGRGTSFDEWIAGALFGMGLLDGLHALYEAGPEFVWLHSCANFFGGVLFALVWVPSDRLVSLRRLWPQIVLIGTTVFGVVSCALPRFIPAMVEAGEFTSAAMALNVIGGVAFFAAMVKIVLTYRQTRVTEDLLFCLHSGLFGGAAIMFEQSTLWDASWWGWHLLRFMAYVAALWFVMLSLSKLQLDWMRELKQRKETQRRLERAMAKAEMATKSKSDFLANMSHELRTPMTAILGFAENMTDPDISEDARADCVQTIRRNGQYLLQLVDNILDLSKVESGKMIPEFDTCKPCTIIAEVASLMRVRADAKRIALTIEFGNAIPETIRTDATRVRQILINLIGNAIKFTESGSVRLVTTFVDGVLPCMQFDVTDTGVGMTDDQKRDLFQQFTQADPTTSRMYGGTGLGLAISKQFAGLLGGDVVIAWTEPGKGTTFRATVATGSREGVRFLEDPLSPTTIDVSPIGVVRAKIASDELSGIKILFAEDGLDNQRLISFVLTRAGAEVVVVENGKLAVDATLAAHGSQAFNCVLLDMQMPVMDGYEAARQLRQRGYAGTIIAVTACAMNGDRERCVEAGCDDYITKPIDRRVAVNTILSHINRRAA